MVAAALLSGAFDDAPVATPSLGSRVRLADPPRRFAERTDYYHELLWHFPNWEVVEAVVTFNPEEAR